MSLSFRQLIKVEVSDIHRQWYAPELLKMSVLSERRECLLVLGDIANLFEFVLLLGIFLLKELLLKLLDVLLDLLEHPPNVKLIIGQIVDEHSFIAGRCRMSSILVLIRVLLVLLAVSLDVKVLLLLLFTVAALIIVDKLILPRWLLSRTSSTFFAFRGLGNDNLSLPGSFEYAFGLPYSIRLFLIWIFLIDQLIVESLIDSLFIDECSRVDLLIIILIHDSLEFASRRRRLIATAASVSRSLERSQPQVILVKVFLSRLSWLEVVVHRRIRTMQHLLIILYLPRTEVPLAWTLIRSLTLNPRFLVFHSIRIYLL